MAKESYASHYRQVKHHLHTLLAQKKIVLMGKIGDQVNDHRFLLMFLIIAISVIDLHFRTFADLYDQLSQSRYIVLAYRT